MRECVYCGKPITLNQKFQAGFNPLSESRDYWHVTCPKESPMSTDRIDNILDTASYATRRMRTEMIINSGNPFYIVFNPTSDKPSKSKLAFETEEEALKVAELMARKCLDEQFFVMRSTCFAQTQQPVVVTKFQNELTPTTKPKPTRKR